MSAIAALKGYRTQFLYSLYYILNNKDKPYRYRLEGEEDMDVLDEQGKVLYAIQVKNLTKTLTLSDLLSLKKTSFIKRFLDLYPASIPMLVSYGPVSEELKSWRLEDGRRDAREYTFFQKAGISDAQVRLVKAKMEFTEIIQDDIKEDVLRLLKLHKGIDPVPTAEYLLYYLQYTAERQQIISSADLLQTIDRMGVYLSERIAYTSQYGIFIKPLTENDGTSFDKEKLQQEFYYGVSARYEHIYCGLDVLRDHYLESIEDGFRNHNILVIHGASGQGKSALAYRYVFNNSAQSLIYEISLQDDPEQTRQAILAISAMTKGLHVPVYFLLHVAPNTTSWLTIAREFANHTFMRLLVTVRNEDWHRAQSAEINFLHTDLELELTEQEAEVIYSKLESRKLVIKHLDFKDAWQELKPGVPLLEFTYSVTQGNALRDKLKGQLAQLNIEESRRPTGQLELLQNLCLADAFGARIEARLTKDIPNIRLIIDKFEKEYLIKQSSDGKYLTGLHPIRSQLLSELLFDEFIICKKDYVLSCLKMIAGQDAYPFLLQVIYFRIMTPKELIETIIASGRNSWIFYGAAAKSMLWAGIRAYVDENQEVFDRIFEKSGDAWSVLADIQHGVAINNKELVKLLTSENQEVEDFLQEMNCKLSPKSTVYEPVTMLFDLMELPPAPDTSLDWQWFAETIFWLGKIPNQAKKLDGPNAEDFRKAFSELDFQSLSLLMLGMHSYSEDFDQIRHELAPIFNHRIMKEYCIPLLTVGEEISAHFIVPINDGDISSNWHNTAMSIIDLLRSAYPEKKTINSQGHGHHLAFLPLMADDSRKNIPADNLPLKHWVSINATTRRLYDYTRRPEDWSAFYRQLISWEQDIKHIIHEFIRSFKEFRSKNDMKKLLTVSDQFGYSSLSRLSTPKTAADPLGLPLSSESTAEQLGKSITQNNPDNKELYLSEKYKPFFKSYYDYKAAIENFIRQSGAAMYDLIKKQMDTTHVLNEDNLRKSFHNLYDAVAYREEFETQKRKVFGKFDETTSSLTDTDLFTAATAWRTFWNSIAATDIKRLSVNNDIGRLKSDFFSALDKSIKLSNRRNIFNISYQNDVTTRHLPVFTVQADDPIEVYQAVAFCYQLIFDCVNKPDYTALKYMMLRRYFPSVYIISQVRGLLLDMKWMEFPLHLFIDRPLEDLPVHHLIPKDIDAEIASAMQLKSWLIIHPGMREVQELAANFSKFRLYIGHMADLKIFDENDNLGETGQEILLRYIDGIGRQTDETWNALIEKITRISADLEQHGGTEENYEVCSLLLEVFNLVATPASEEQANVFSIRYLQEWSSRLTAFSQQWGEFIMLLQKRILARI